MNEIRLDKFLWAVRLVKTRSLAVELIKSAKVLVNNNVAKPAQLISQGDTLQLKKNTAVFSYKIVSVLNNRISASLVNNFIEDITPETELEKFRQYQSSQREYRIFQSGKPSKNDRQKIRKFFDNS